MCEILLFVLDTNYQAKLMGNRGTEGTFNGYISNHWDRLSIL